MGLAGPRVKFGSRQDVCYKGDRDTASTYCIPATPSFRGRVNALTLANAKARTLDER